jgi:hypothetical protein
MRTVYRLQGLVRRYGADRVDRACSLSLDLDVVGQQARLHARARHRERRPGTTTGSRRENTRFTRSPSEFGTPTTPLTVVTDEPAAQEI